MERDRGDYMYEGLLDIFSELRIGLDVIQQFGALCLDVQFGPEVEAFKRLGAPRVIACEPDAAVDKEDDGVTKFRVMAQLGVGMNLRVVKEYALPALSQLAQETPRVQVGAVTNLNVFPRDLGSLRVARVVRAALPLLAPDGVVVVSAREDPRYVMEKFTAAAEAVSDIAAVSCFARPATSAGSCFLIAHSARSVRP